MQEDGKPKVFISYSWSSDDVVVPLAERLMSHGVSVVLDKWELKEGQDKYAFMERCVNDDEITKVLIICNRKYAEKANSRIGGVGDETLIISGEVYNKVEQEKFIPIVTERDEQGNPYLPTYIKSRIYIDLSNYEYFEDEYEKLIRNIYDKPLYTKPKLGKRPDWLDENKKTFFNLVDLIQQVKGSNSKNKQSSCINKFINEYIETLKTYFIKSIGGGEQIYFRFREMKDIRDIFLDFLPVLSESDCCVSDVLCDSFERMYNTLTCSKNFNGEVASERLEDYEIYYIFIWELFICVITYLRSIKDYKTINGMINNTYFLVKSFYDDTVVASNYCRFRHYSRVIEENYKPTTELKTKFTLLGHLICSEREKFPVYTKKTISESDLFLYQIYNAFNFDGIEPNYNTLFWFPTMYLYVDLESPVLEWNKIKSRKFCYKLFDLFGVSSFNELKNSIKNCVFDPSMKYSNSYYAAPAILNCIKLDEIGSIN